ncbi:WD repeat domain 90 [Perkinsus olseni]|uniref:WD repeat domain 90 n=2 Tax=Perkinsus olseni TaxID=32597 RepID=A0A7J6LM28_PEROL|nr:WD repeat domain 90 [Perkinsus olseni]
MLIATTCLRPFFVVCLLLPLFCDAQPSNLLVSPSEQLVVEVAKWSSTTSTGPPRVAVVLHSDGLVDYSNYCELNRVFGADHVGDHGEISHDISAELDRIAASVAGDPEFARVRFIRASKVDPRQARITVFIGKDCQASLQVTPRTAFHLLPGWLVEVDLPLSHYDQIPEWLLQTAVERGLPLLVMSTERAPSGPLSYGYLADMRAHQHTGCHHHSRRVRPVHNASGYCNPLSLREDTPLCRRQLLVVQQSDGNNETQLLDYDHGDVYFHSDDDSENLESWIEDYFYSRLTPSASLVVEEDGRDHKSGPDVFKILFVALLVAAPHYTFVKFNVACAASILVIAFAGNIPGSIIGALLVASRRAREMSNFVATFSSYLAMLAAEFNCDHVLVTWQQGDTNALENFNDAKVSDPTRLFSASDDKLYRACSAHGGWSMVKTLTQGEFMSRSFFKKLGAFNHNYKGGSLNGSAVVVLEKAADGKGAEVLYSLANSESFDASGVVKALGGSEEQASLAAKRAEEAVDKYVSERA